MRVASCSVNGLPDAARNERRLELLHDIARLLQQCPPVDAVVLPGGYFVQQDKPNHYLDLSFEGRRGLLRDAPFAADATEVARQLDEGALLIFGVDTGGPKSAMGDQLCVAWSADGPAAIGRKVFPTEGEGKCGYVVNVDDFGAEERVVSIGDTRVLLCACYDGYGIANDPDKSRFVRRIFDRGERARRGDPTFRQSLRSGLRGWRRLVRTVDTAAVAIHYFRDNGGFHTNYWRRHGIATASAKLHGGCVVGAANFEARLPRPGADILVAHGVPSEHLSEGNNRATCDATPTSEHFVGNEEVLVRLFDFGGRQAD